MGNNANNVQNTGRSQNNNVATPNNEKILEISKYVFEQVNNWTENADNKVNTSCGIFTGVFGVISFLSTRVIASDAVNEYWSKIYHISFVLSFLMLIVAIWFYVKAISPNLGKSGVKQEKSAVTNKNFPIFFGDIAELSLPEYKGKINQATDQDFIDELQAEIVFNSENCNKKMKNYRRGLWGSFIAILAALISAGSHIMMFR